MPPRTQLSSSSVTSSPLSSLCGSSKGVGVGPKRSNWYEPLSCMVKESELAETICCSVGILLHLFCLRSRCAP